jgi:hypothetical protein
MGSPSALPNIMGSLDFSVYLRVQHYDDNFHKLIHSTFDMLCLLSISQHHDRVFLLLPEMWQKLRMQILHEGLPRF